jgi:GH24 family phage-related lysozyme (muramidase)
MTPAAACATLIKRFEQCRLSAYLPTPDDHWTCGWGSTGNDIGPDTVWTQQEADDRFDADLAKFGQGVSALLTGPTTQNQYDALVSFAYNAGLTALADSTLLRMHNAGDYADAAGQFGRWIHQGGVVLNGLVTRRRAEAAMYQGSTP